MIAETTIEVNSTALSSFWKEACGNTLI